MRESSPYLKKMLSNGLEPLTVAWQTYHVKREGDLAHDALLALCSTN